MKFEFCLEAIAKHAGLLDTVKEIATTPIAGTKPWFIGRGPKPLTDSLRSAGTSGVRQAVRPTVTKTLGQAGGARVYDVSDMARKMGIT